VRQSQRLFRQLGFRLRKPRPVIAKADPQMQSEHKKLRKMKVDNQVDLWSTDEVHFQQHGLRNRM
jgi:Winged helix-turn helix